MKHRNLSLAAALRTLVALVVLVAVSAFVTARVVSDDKGQPSDPMQSEEWKEMEKKYEEAGRVGPHHKHMEPFIGEWNAECKYWMGPGEPMTSKASSSNRWIMDGRFVQLDYKGEWQGKTFTGMSIMGYDNIQKKYYSTWIDSMSTSLYVQSGACDESGKTFTFEGEAPCPITSGMKKHKTVYKVISKDKHVFEMYEPGPDGQMAKNMEITYTRK